MPELSRYIGKITKQNHEWLVNVDARDFLERLKVDNIRDATANELQFSCPFDGHAHGDETPSAYMNNGNRDKSKNTAFKCFSCGRSGNAITFYAEHEKCSRMEAINVLRDVYAPNWRAPQGGTIAKEFRARRRALEKARAVVDEPMTVLDWSQYEQFDVDWQEGRHGDPALSYMYDRGFSAADLIEWRIGYDPRSDRITIPVCDPDGNLVGIKARTWKPKAQERIKYLNLGDKEGKRKRYGFMSYEKSRVVFGLHMWGEQKWFVFVEGEIDVISLWKMGIPAICTGSAALSEEQAKIIRNYCDGVILFLDDDLAGINAVWGYEGADGEHHPGIIEALEPFVHLKKVGQHKYDANDYLVRGEQERLTRLINRAKPTFKLFAPDRD